MINLYFDRYVRFNPEKWVWTLWPGFHQQASCEEVEENQKKYLEFRARKSDSKGPGKFENRDVIPPDFYSVERDAVQFNLQEVTVTDFFGIKWAGKKGKTETVFAPDYEGHLYFYPEKDDENCYDDEPLVSEEYSDKNPPPSEFYFFMEKSYPTYERMWINFSKIVKAEYKYHVCNHLFKYTHIEIMFSDGEVFTLFEEDCYAQFLCVLEKFGKDEMVNDIYSKMNEHFNALRDSEREEERAFWPGMTAEEYFGGEEEIKFSISHNLDLALLLKDHRYYWRSYIQR